MADNFTPDQLEVFRQITEQMSSLNTAIDPVIASKKAEQMAAMELANGIKQSTLKAVHGLENFTGALVNGKDGYKKYGKAVQEVTDGFGDLLEVIGLFTLALDPLIGVGLLIGGKLTKSIGDFVETATERNDELLKSFRNLSEFGDITAGGLEGLNDQLHRFGYTFQDAEKFVNLIKGAAPELARFGDSVSDGTARLGELSGEILNGPIEFQLRRLGYTTDDVNKELAVYAQTQVRLGMSQRKSVAQMTEEFTQLAKLTAEINEYTGMERDEIAKKMEATQRDIAWQLYSQELAEKDADKARKASNFMTEIGTAYNDEVEGQIKKIIMLGGATEDTVGAIQSFPNIFQDYEDYINSDQIGQRDEVRNRMKQEVYERSKQINYQNLALMGDGVKNFSVNLQAQSKAFEMATGARINAEKRVIEALTRHSELLEENNLQEVMNRNNRIAQDRIGMLATKGLVGGINSLEKATYSAFRTMGAAIDWVTSFLPEGWRTHLKQDLPEMKDQGDLKELQDQNETLKKREDLLKQLLDNAEYKNMTLGQIFDKEVDRAKDINAQLKKEKDATERDRLQKELKDVRDRLNSIRDEEYSDDKGQMKGDVKQHLERLKAQQASTTNQIATLQTQLGMNSGGGGTSNGNSGNALSGDYGKVTPTTLAAIEKMHEIYGGRVPPHGTTQGEHDDPAHYRGTAFDYVLPDDMAPKTKAEADILAETIKQQLGATRVLEEYFDKYDKTVGHVMHINMGAANGGLISGPKSGYPFLGHGTELVIPGADKLKEFKGGSKEPLSSIFGGDDNKEMIELLTEFNSKMDSFIYIMESNNGIQENILRHMKV